MVLKKPALPAFFWIVNELRVYACAANAGSDAVKGFEKPAFQFFINEKTINPTETINIEMLKKLKLINKNSQKLKILGTGEIKDKVNIEADLASKSAIEKLEKISGSIQLKK